MIKAEVVFDGDKIRLKGTEYCIDVSNGHFKVFKSGKFIRADFLFCSEAIKYCMEH